MNADGWRICAFCQGAVSRHFASFVGRTLGCFGRTDYHAPRQKLGCLRHCQLLERNLS
jgi:hypothetical protein